MKIERRPATVLLPTRSCSSAWRAARRGNFLTIAWTGVVCSSPPMLSVAIRPPRYSHGLRERRTLLRGEHPGRRPARAGRRRRRDLGRGRDKFAELGLTALPATKVSAPLIAECPINVECVVRHQLALGAHDLYIGEVVAVHYDEELLDSRGRLKVRALHPIAFVEGEYWSLGERLGTYGGPAKARPGAGETGSRYTRPPVRYYVTTPIYYVNAEPHLGHAYSTIAADVLARHHRQRGEDVFFLTGHRRARRAGRQAARERGSRPRELADERAALPRAGRAPVDASNDFFIRTTDPEHEAACRRSSSASTTTGTSTRASTRAGTARAAPTSRPSASSRTATPARSTDRADVTRGGELVLPALRVSGPSSTSCFRPTPTSSAARPPQRGALVHQAGPRGRLARRRADVGRAGAVGPEPGDLRLVRRAAQLRHGAHLRARGRGPHRALLARHRPRDRQGHPQVPRRHLAGPAHGAGYELPRGRAHPRLPADGRREDVEVARQRARPVRGDRPLRRRRAALLPAARGPLGQDGDVTPAASRRATRPSSPTSYGNLGRTAWR